MHVLLKHATKYLGAETVCLRYTNFHHNGYGVLFSDRGASDSPPPPRPRFLRCMVPEVRGAGMAHVLRADNGAM